MTATPRLAITELVSAQAVPEATVNEGLLILEFFANGCHFKSRATTAEPGSPAEGDAYLLPVAPTGTHWSGNGGKIALFYNGAWSFKSAKEGFTAWVDDEDVFVGYTGASWTTLSNGSNPTESFVIAASDETTALTTGDKVTFRIPYAFTLTSVKASLTTAQTSGTIFTIDVKKAGSTIFSTKPTIDNTEKTTATAATAAVLSTTALADDDEIVVNINQIGDGTAKGLKVVLIGHR